MKICVGLDLGTSAGWVKWNVSDTGDLLLDEGKWGAYDLKQALIWHGESGRWSGYRTLLGELGDADVFYFEDVPAAVHSAAGAARIHGGLRAILQLFCLDYTIPLVSVSIQSAKRALTGSQTATKQMMKRAATVRYGVRDRTPAGDTADALGVLLAGIQKSGMKA